MQDNARLTRAYTNAVEIANRNTLGNILAISGSILSLFGALINNIFLSHTQAMMIWMVSNPILLVYFVGMDMKLWNGSHHLSNRAIICLYLVFTITNFYGVISE